MMALSEIPLTPGRVMAISAHPDDAEFYAGATLAELMQRGASIRLVVCTDGSRGGRDLPDPVPVRRQEQKQAAGLLGIDEIVHLDHRDGELVADGRLRETLAHEIRRGRPELVLTHDPHTFWQQATGKVELGHSDHREAGIATLDAIYPRAANPNFYPEQVLKDGLQPWYPREVWLFDTAHADLVLDVSATFEIKLRALAVHASQEAVTGGLVKPAAAAAAQLGTADRPAEGFVRLRLW